LLKLQIKCSFPSGTIVRANREKGDLIGWRRTMTTLAANHIQFLLVRAKKVARREKTISSAQTNKK
jgi:hypothetical protein